MEHHEDTQFDRFLAQLVPPVHIGLAIAGSLVLAAVLLFFPGFTRRYEIEQLAFGVTICWIPAGGIGLLIDALRAKDRARRAWDWLGIAVLVGLAGVLLLGGMQVRGEETSVRIGMLLVCIPAMLPPLIPAGVALLGLWRELE